MLTDAQMTDVRRYAGYWLVGTTQPVTANTDTVYVRFGMTVMSLYTRLTTFSASEEAVLVNTYLAKLATLETDIVGSAANLDTDVAAVWTHNKREVQDRTALFDMWRQRMCEFIGLPPGPGLGGATKIMRA